MYVAIQWWGVAGRDVTGRKSNKLSVATSPAGSVDENILVSATDTVKIEG
jgi:hypothetical protein